MANFEHAVQHLLKLEGGFSAQDNTAGAVNFGITERFLRSIGVEADAAFVRRLTRDEAVALYQKHFWAPLSLDQIQDQALAEELFDAAVNMGPGRAVQCLQQVVGVKADGRVGPKTIAAANLAGSGALPAFQAALKARYRSIGEHNSATCGDDLEGWLRRVDA